MLPIVKKQLTFDLVAVFVLEREMQKGFKSYLLDISTDGINAMTVIPRTVGVAISLDLGDR